MVRFIFTLLTLLFFQLPASVSALEFSLFGDTSYTYSDSTQSFAIGSFNLIADQHVSDTTSITTDLIFETGGHGIEIELERFKITKETELTDITLGRFHKTLGFWNHNFNHGSLSQDTASRPFFLELDHSHEGIFPAHLVGLLLGKEYKGSSWQFAYANNAGMNTDETNTTDPEPEAAMKSLNSGDTSKFKSYAFRGTYQLTTGFEVGLFLLANNIIETGDAANLGVEHGDILFTQEVVGLDASFKTPNYYAFGEYYHIIIEDNPAITGISFNNSSYTADAYYIQLGYRYSEKIRLALRYESLDFDSNATLLALHHLEPETRVVAALNYRMEESNSLRLEINQIDQQGHDPETTVTLQWFFYLL